MFSITSMMYFITVECDIATLALSNGEIETYYNYYEGHGLYYSCDKGYSTTTRPVCTQSGNWSHDPGCSKDTYGEHKVIK